jgi:tRNA A37 threonylcarbamoyladenosine biosynthesis protein TsaE
MWLDVDLMFSPHKVTVIEWAERFEGWLPSDRLELRLEHLSTNRRRIILIGVGPRADRLITQLQPASSSAAESKIQNPKSKISAMES